MSDTGGRLAARLQHPGAIRAMAVFVAAGALLYLGALAWSGWEQALATIGRLGGGALLAGGLAASSSYLWRFARWDHALSRFGYRIPRRRNLAVYVAGLALTTSPGKLGETLRSVLLLPDGVRAGHSLGAFVADRMADVFGICLLGMLAGLLGGGAAGLLAGVFVGGGLCSLLASHAVLHPASGRLWSWFARRLRWLPVRGGQAALEAWATLWTAPRALAFALLAVLAYGTQGLVFAWFCSLAGVPIDPAQALLVFVNATLFGAASMVPGGLGAMEAALVFQLVGYGADGATAVSIAVGIRLVTLWLGIGLGLAALLSLRQPSALQEAPEAAENVSR